MAVWLGFAVGAYFINATTTILDKFLLSSDRLPRPAAYAFLTALFSLAIIVFFPSGIAGISLIGAFFSLASGVSFAYALVFLYKSVQCNSVSRVAPLVGTATAATALLPFLALTVSVDVATALLGLSAFALMVVGAFLAAVDLPLKDRLLEVHCVSTWKDIILAGFLFAFSNFLLKLNYVFDGAGFAEGVVWSRFGLFLGGLSLLLIPVWKDDVMAFFRSLRRGPAAPPLKRLESTFVLFLVNKVLAGVGALLLALAIYTGPAGLVQALVGTQFVFVAVLAAILDNWYPEVFHERLTVHDWAQKIGAILLISGGLLIARALGAFEALPFA